MGNVIAVILSIIAGIFLGVLSNWIYDILRARGYFPNRPSIKKIAVVIAIASPLVLFVLLPSLQENRKSLEDSPLDSLSQTIQGDSNVSIQTQGDGDVHVVVGESSSPTPVFASPEIRLLWEGSVLLSKGDVEGAESKFEEVIVRNSDSADALYWMAQIPISSNNNSNNRMIAIEYINRALDKNPDHIHSIVLKIKLLLVSQQKQEAETVANAKYRIDDQLDEWLDCLDAWDVYAELEDTSDERFAIEEPELEEWCPSPAYEWEE